MFCGTPANWLLPLGLNMSSYDVAQQQNTLEEVYLKTVRITERGVKADNARNILETVG